MLPPYDKHLRFKLSAVRTYQAWLLALFISAALLLMFYTSIPLLVKVMILMVLLAVLLRQWQKLGRLPRELIKQGDLDWVVEDLQGNSQVAVLEDNAYVTTWCIVLHFKLADEKYISVVILPFMTDRNSFRRLNVHLRTMDLQMPRDE